MAGGSRPLTLLRMAAPLPARARTQVATNTEALKNAGNAVL